MKWIDVNKRLPSNEQIDKNWKFLVSHEKDEWVDTAYYFPKAKDKWHNGEVYIYPTHWRELPECPTKK